MEGYKRSCKCHLNQNLLDMQTSVDMTECSDENMLSLQQKSLPLDVCQQPRVSALKAALYVAKNNITTKINLHKKYRSYLSRT